MILNAMLVLAIGLAPLLLPVPFLLHGARQGRRLIVVSPCLLGAAVYITTFLAAHWSRPPVSTLILWLHMFASAMPMLLLLPSFLALRRKWLSILHLLTLTGLVGSLLIGSVLIDGT